MKTWEEQGGAAFPVPENSIYRAEVGMSLRDYFAAQALPAVYDALKYHNSYSGIARESYKIADAMLAEREKERENE